MKTLIPAISRKKTLWAVIALTAALALVWAVTLYKQRASSLAAQAYIESNMYKDALREFDAALGFYTPLSPYNETAAEGLWRIGEIYEQAGEHQMALEVYSTLRGGFMAARWLYIPGLDWIARAEEKIASLNIVILLKDGVISASEAPMELQRFHKMLKNDPWPDTLWSLLAVVSFLCWTMGAAALAWKGFREDGTLKVSKETLYRALACVASFVVWIVALWRA